MASAVAAVYAVRKRSHVQQAAVHLRKESTKGCEEEVRTEHPERFRRRKIQDQEKRREYIMES